MRWTVVAYCAWSLALGIVLGALLGMAIAKEADFRACQAQRIELVFKEPVDRGKVECRCQVVK